MTMLFHEQAMLSGTPRLAAVTGATGAIGQAIAQRLAAMDGYGVVLVCRDDNRARQMVKAIRQVTGSKQVWYELADLSRKASIQALANRWPAGLNILVNNAAVAPRQRQETAEGIEMQWATNVLGYQWMIAAFTEMLQRSAPSRVVNVASYWAGDLDLSDLEFKRRPYHNNRAYRQSKQANRMLTAASAARLASLGISVNVCHPGDVNSQLSNNLGFGGHEAPETAARTPVWLATSDAAAGETGNYYEHQRQVHCRFAADRAAVEALFAICQAYQA